MTDLAGRNSVFLRRFGTPAWLIRQTDGSTEEFVGVFSAPTRDANVRVGPGMMLAVSSAEPAIWVDLQLARIDAEGTVSPWTGAVPTQDDQVAVAGVTYQIIDPQPDGQGGLKLVLQRQDA
jgi:hypothetical protein